MTSSFYECKVRYERTNHDNGSVRKVTENYVVVHALSFADVETIATGNLTPLTEGEIDILSIKSSTISDIYLSNEAEDNHFFKAKIVYITLDEKSGNEKKISEYVLVQAKSPEEAIKRMNKELECIAVEIQIASIVESNIVDVLK
jgi:hypothetical protein